MRNGNLSVCLRPLSGEPFFEQPDGRVYARSGAVYTIDITNHASRRQVAIVRLDGIPVAESGIVIPARSTVRLERPVDGSDRGRFTVCAEGDEDAFGADGGRDNLDLGLVEVEAREELALPWFTPTVPVWVTPNPYPRVGPWVYPLFQETTRPSWTLTTTDNPNGHTVTIGCNVPITPTSVFNCSMSSVATASTENLQAAGTGLTGSSDQRFTPISVGMLSSTCLRVALRLVIGSASQARPRPLQPARSVPVRPPARP